VTALPLLLLLLDYWPLRRLSWSTVAEKWPLAILSLASAVITVLSVARTWQFGTPPPTGFLKPFLKVSYLLAFYLGKIVWPTNLTCVYPPPHFSFDDRVVLLSLITVCGLILLLAFCARRAPGALAGSLFFVVALAPTFGIVRWSLIIAYDRYLYFPMLGILLILGSGLATAWRSRALQSTALKGALLALLFLVTAVEARGLRVTLRPWRDSVSLWRHIETLAPQIAEAHNGLGAALLARSANTEAIQQFRRAVELDPSYPFAQFNLGYVLSQLGRADEAIPHLLRTCALMPGSPSAALQLGIAELHAGKLEEAEADLRRALAIKPGYADVVDPLAIVLVLLGRTDEGIGLIRNALALPLDDARAPYSLATALLRTRGHDAEALDLLRRAIRLKPDWAAPYDDVAWLLATNADPSLRNPSEALRFADRAVEITGGRDASALDTQAAALAAVGQYDRAVQCARRALALAPQDSANTLARAIGERLAMYGRRVSYIEPTVTDSALNLR
jgi:tetratricopeptide (TPR) repeat protein